MRKIITLFMTCLTLVNVADAQNAFYDAILIKNKYVDDTGAFAFKKDNAHKTELSGILKGYLPDILKNNPNLTTGQVLIQYKDNPFIGKELTKLNAGSSANKAGPFNKITALAGGVDVTKYADAVADLMIDRAKEELTVAFFNRFQLFIEKNPEFRALFPTTTENIRALLSYDYSRKLPVLQAGFIEDLEQLTYHLESVLELPRYKALLKDLPEVRIAVRSLKVVHQLETGESNAADVIKNFAAFKDWDGTKNVPLMNMRSSVKLASIFSESLRYDKTRGSATDTNRIWVSGNDIKDLVSNDTITRIYLGLVYQQIKNENIEIYVERKKKNDTINIARELGKYADNFFLLQNKLSEFISLADKVTSSYKDIKIKKAAGIKVSNEDVYSYISTSIDITDYTFGIAKIFDPSSDADQYLSIARKSNAIYKNVYSKQYTLAASNAIDILTEIYNMTQQHTKDSLAEINDRMKTKGGSAERTGGADLKKIKKTLTDYSDSLAKLTRFIDNAKPYIMVVANIADATTSKDVKAALNNAILPPGSSSIKKHSLCNISVQSYLGAYYSLKQADNGTYATGAWSDRFGVTAPIGISFTPGFASMGKWGSVSGFISIFDLGAIVDYKLSTDTTVLSNGTKQPVASKDYSVKLANIVSPGGYMVYGFGANIPLSFGLGAQYGPGLSKINVSGSVVTNPAIRWNAFLAVDLPFFTIHNKARK